MSQLDQPDPSNLKIGFIDNNGWRYAGISETTGTRLWVAEKDAGTKMSWNKAIKWTQKLKDFQGYNGSKQYKSTLLEDSSLDDGGVRMPTKEEFKQLYENKENIQADLGKTFNRQDVWYWTSSEDNDAPILQVFELSGQHFKYFKESKLLVHCVRTEPRPQM